MPPKPIDAQPPTILRLRQQLVHRTGTSWPFLPVVAAAGVAFASGLTSPFWLDDDVNLLSARELPIPAYNHAVFTPWGSEPLLPFTRDYWRPLAFIWFELLEPVAGGHPLPYHLLVLGGHLAAVVLTWLVAACIDDRRAVRAIAAGALAVYPGTYQAVTWISSVNSIALPLALGVWLAFLRCTDRPGEVRWRPVALAVLLLALAVMTRESAWVALPVIAGWHLAVACRWQLRSRAAWLPLLPFAALAVAYAVIRTCLFTEPLANRDIFDWGSHAWRNYRTLLELLLFPFRERIEGLHGWRKLLQELSVTVIPLLTVACVLLGRWRPAVLFAGALISLLAVAPNLPGIGPRYPSLGATSLTPAVRWYYPEAAGAVYIPPGIRPELGPGDVLFVAP